MQECVAVLMRDSTPTMRKITSTILTSAARAVEIPAGTLRPGSEPVSDIIEHKKVGISRSVMWRAGKNMVYWRLLLDLTTVSSVAGSATMLCQCESCTNLYEATFPSPISEKVTLPIGKRKKRQ